MQYFQEQNKYKDREVRKSHKNSPMKAGTLTFTVFSPSSQVPKAEFHTLLLSDFFLLDFPIMMRRIVYIYIYI